MKDYKLLLVGLTLLLLIIFIGIFAWLWNSNRKNIDPLPITVSENGQSSTNNEDDSMTIATNILYVQAEDRVQLPLDDVIARFESRYPKIQVLAHYVPANALFTLPDTSTSNNELSAFIVNIDIIIADDKLTQTRLTSLQATINNTQSEPNQSKINANGMVQDNGDDATISNTSKTDDNEARNLASFSYAVKGTQAVDGVILTDNPVAINFRNFLLSSAGQDILKKYDYGNIEGYKNSVDDLFNPTSGTKTATGKKSVKVADALSNGK
ncbi:hypothetical protein [Psychrobacter sp. CAL346-MNA-CIBAN-0220]|uniref:hypothetical protein n=1 Tax=Psychrobacter sp. CAL346-MNA-CIBAN-0220 TaxID=3140457 RepID=UPI003325837A